MNDRNNRTNSVQIGVTCIVTYIASYCMRNLLGVLTPGMLDTGEYTKEYIGVLSSAYMFFYAIGQLTNGMLGDKISPKKMIIFGLFLSGTSSVSFPLSESYFIEIICFGLLGYGLSMLRGPMMKIIAENTSPGAARIICAFFSSASFIGAFIAGIFAALFRWNMAFIIAGCCIYLIAAIAYFAINFLEKNNMVKYCLSKNNNFVDVLSVFKADRFIFYLIIGIVSEIIGSSISFWIPTYLTEHLGFDKNSANVIFTIKSILRATAPFITILIYKYWKDEIRIIKYTFLISAILLCGMMPIKNEWINILLLMVALTISACASSVLWSIYIPSLKSTGRVSSANGILDCTGYIGAAVANVLFAKIAENLGWNDVMLLWISIMLVGFFVALFKQIQIKKA